MSDTTLLVRGSFYDTMPNELRELFEQYGHVKQVKIHNDDKTAEVEYLDPLDAEDALILDGQKLNDEIIRVEMAPQIPRRSPTAVRKSPTQVRRSLSPVRRSSNSKMHPDTTLIVNIITVEKGVKSTKALLIDPNSTLGKQILMQI